MTAIRAMNEEHKPIGVPNSNSLGRTCEESHKTVIDEEFCT